MILKNICLKLFFKINTLLLNSKYNLKIKYLTILNFKNRIIETTICNYLKFFMLGIWTWKSISKCLLKTMLINNNNIKKKTYNHFLIKNEIFIKNWKTKTNYVYYKIKSKNTINSVLKSIKFWSIDIKYFFNYYIKKNFNNTSKRKLSFFILKYIKNCNINIVINKIFIFQKIKTLQTFSLFVQLSFVYFFSKVLRFFLLQIINLLKTYKIC